MAEKSRGAALDRVAKLLGLLLEGEELTPKEAAEKIGLQRAQAGRQLRELAKVLKGVVKSGHPASYRFDWNRYRKPPSLAQALAASIGASFAPLFAGSSYEQQFREIRQDCIDRLSKRGGDFQSIDRKIVAIHAGEELLKGRDHILDDTLDAILRHNLLQLDYMHFSGEREHVTVKPLSLAVANARLYVIAQGDDGPPYPYRFSRILNAEGLDQRFDYPSQAEYDPAAMFRDSMGVFINPDPVQIVCRLDLRWETYVKHHRWHSSQVLVPKDDHIELRFNVRPCPEFYQWVRGFGRELVVVSPDFVRDEVKKTLESALGLYTQSEVT